MTESTATVEGTPHLTIEAYIALLDDPAYVALKDAERGAWAAVDALREMSDEATANADWVAAEALAPIWGRALNAAIAAARSRRAYASR